MAGDVAVAYSRTTFPIIGTTWFLSTGKTGKGRSFSTSFDSDSSRFSISVAESTHHGLVPLSLPSSLHSFSYLNLILFSPAPQQFYVSRH